MQEKIISILSEALMGEDVSVDSNTTNLAAWDSLGHLSILSALDNATGGKISEISEFNDVTSVSEILELCEKHRMEF